MKIYLDFDGTVVEHEYPKIGRCNFGCFEVIKKLQDAGHEFILNTVRADMNNGTLEAALKLINEDHWMLLKDHIKYEDFEIKPITEWCKEKQYPDKFDLDLAYKVGVLYIDDQALGTPLKKACMNNSMMVDWDALDKIFEEKGLYNKIN